MYNRRIEIRDNQIRKLNIEVGGRESNTLRSTELGSNARKWTNNSLLNALIGDYVEKQ